MWMLLETGEWAEVSDRTQVTHLAAVYRITHTEYGDCHRWQVLDYTRYGLVVDGLSERGSLEIAQRTAEHELRGLANHILQVVPRSDDTAESGLSRNDQAAIFALLALADADSDHYGEELESYLNNFCATRIPGDVPERHQVALKVFQSLPKEAQETVVRNYCAMYDSSWHSRN